MALIGFLKQSTASQTRLTPGFVDDTDFKTAETALTINNTDVKLSKNGGTSANKNSGGGTHIVNGRYALTFDATDTSDVGSLGVSISVAGALINEFDFVVLEERVYDQLYASGAAGMLATDTIAEYAQGAPPLSPTAEQILNYLYRVLVRNKLVTDTNTANTVASYLDNDSTIAFKSTISDASSIATRAKAVTGP